MECFLSQHKTNKPKRIAAPSEKILFIVQTFYIHYNEKFNSTSVPFIPFFVAFQLAPRFARLLDFAHPAARPAPFP